jgi:hypothetical protein
MTEIKVIKKADDTRLGTKVLRASLGGNPIVGYYVTYRGDIQEIIKLTEDCLATLKALEGKEPEISPDDGKIFA